MTFEQGVQAQRAGNPAEAEAIYRQIIATDARNFDALHMLGIVCTEQGKLDDAERFSNRPYRSIRERFPAVLPSQLWAALFEANTIAGEKFAERQSIEETGVLRREEERAQWSRTAPPAHSLAPDRAQSLRRRVRRVADGWRRASIVLSSDRYRSISHARMAAATNRRIPSTLRRALSSDPSEITSLRGASMTMGSALCLHQER